MYLWMMPTITVEGMTCGQCEQTAEETLEAVSGTSDATGNREAEQDDSGSGAEVPTLVAAVEDGGYTVHA